MRNGSDTLLAALDVGSYKICCLIARDEGEGVLRVLGVGHELARGTGGGSIIDMGAAEDAIRGAVHAAEKMAGETIRSVVVNLSGRRLHSERFEVAVGLDGREIEDAHVNQANVQARRYSPPPGHELVHLAPTDFAIDGMGGIREPRGIFGEQLVAGFLAVSLGRGALRTLKACVHRCRLDVEAVSFSAHASARAVLAEDEMTMGAVCVDMGAGTTEIAAFSRGALVFADNVPVGGAHVTSDIAYGMATAPAVAERLKTVHGSAINDGGDDSELIDVPEVGEGAEMGPNHLPRARLVNFIRPRIEETFELIHACLEDARLDTAVSRRVVLCGGASTLTGIREIAVQKLGRSVRLGRPRQLRGLTEAANGAAFATCAGLLLLANDRAPETLPAAPSALAKHMSGPLSRVGQWLRENF